jgi:anti-anti-sigma factor
MPPNHRATSDVTRARRESTTISIVGELDMARDGELLNLVISLDPPPGTTVRLDVGEVTFVDSRGLESFLRSRAYLRGRRCELVVQRPQPRLRRLLDLVGLGDLAADDEGTADVEFSWPR